MTAAARTMMADSQAIASSLVVEDIVKKKYRNQEPRPAHLKPPLAESPFGQFPASYHMRDTWSGNKTCRNRDRSTATIRKASKDPVSYLNRSLPKRIQRSVSKDVLSKSLSMTTLLKSQSEASLLSPIKTSKMKVGEKAADTGGFAKKFAENDEEELPAHLRSNFNINGSSIIHKPPPRPLTRSERRAEKKVKDHRAERISELDNVSGYMKKTGKFFIPARKLMNGDVPSNRPLSAPPIRAKRAAKLRVPKIPKAGAYKKRAIDSTQFRKYYDRGDLPVKIDHCAGGNKVLWSSDVRKLDYHVYLPIFVDGLREVDDPYRFLAIQGVIDMIQAAPEKLLPVIPQLILPISKALSTRDTDIICSVLKILQQMMLQNPSIGPAFVPYFRSILPVFNLYFSNANNLGDHFDFNQRRRLDIADLIQETLTMFELYGGEDAFVNIKYMCPTYQSTVL
ncbi:hypothetical protein TrLO_g15161 [Triparma laevis f. longispina]|uniref:Uncharacterized protein n=2 Tax=Triparma laevis TaxID=1534972 RepID=A0A9W7A3Z3_9STRA|nr:hypothetical protein TrLO_g15161 [Triparma laevis f. longispina]